MSRAKHDIIHTLVKDGWCWWYRKYAPGDTVLEGLECDHKLLKFMELARGIEPPTCGLQISNWGIAQVPDVVGNPLSNPVDSHIQPFSSICLSLSHIS
jgi:hypothetical protein